MLKRLALLAALALVPTQALTQSTVTVQGLNPATVPLDATSVFAGGQTLGGNNVTRKFSLQSLVDAVVYTPFSQSIGVNRALIGPATGPSGPPTWRALVGADLPYPTNTTLGGVVASTVAAKRYVTGVNGSGVLVSTQPAASDLTNGLTGSGAVVLQTAPTIAQSINLTGSVSGSIAIKAQSASGTFNFNLPTTAGTVGQALLSDGGVGTGMTWGSKLPLADGTDGQLLIGQTGFQPQFKTITGDVVFNAAGLSVVSGINGVGFPASPAVSSVPVVSAVNVISYEPAPRFEPGGRCTLASGAPVQVTNVLAATALFYTPYKHNLVPIYNGSRIVNRALPEMTVTMTAAQAASNVYDVFVADNGAGVVIGFGPAWSVGGGSNTARGTGAGSTAISVPTGTGLRLNTNAINLRNGAALYTIAANQATYLCTVATQAGGATMAFQTTPAGAAGGNNTWMGVWNAYNRVLFTAHSIDTNSWGLAVGLRNADASASNRINWVDGLQQSFVRARYITTPNTPDGGSNSNVSVDFDLAGAVGKVSSISNALAGFGSSNWPPLVAEAITSGLGFHFVQAREAAVVGTTTYVVGFLSIDVEM